jgi:membrane protease YdiL (CAAX protease family)
MNKPLARIALWIGIMVFLTSLAMILWVAMGGDSSSTASLKWLQFFQTLATFLLPAIIGAWVWSEDHKPFRWLHMTGGAHWTLFVLAILIMLCAMPGINLLADLNSRIRLPESLGFIEKILKEQEEAAAALTERFLQADTIGVLLLNIGLMALLPALAEEVSFRGTMQQLFGNKHVAIWVTAFIFSAIHLQFYGFIPRMLMGAMFGYLFAWTGSLWISITMHFVNNGCAVLLYYLYGGEGDTTNFADTIGAGETWWIGVISIVITSLGLLIFYRRTHIR